MEVRRFCSALDEHLQASTLHILVGDFNVDGRDNENTVVKHIFTKHRLVQKVRNITHDQGNTLDHCYVSSGLNDQLTLFLHHLYYSDHDCICVSLPCT